MKVDIFNTNKKYSIIYADPPWQYKVWSNKGHGRSAESHYPTMSKTDIQNLPIPKLCENNCVLFLWVTYPCLEEGLELIKKWGFTYKTCGFSWVKLNKRNSKPFIGMGYYTRANNEICLLAVKGNPLKRVNRSVQQVILSKKHIHNFNAYLEAMEQLGYNNFYQVLNAKDYGIPQNRERVFTISIRKDINKLFTFPPKQELKLKLKDLLEDEVDKKRGTVQKEMIPTLKTSPDIGVVVLGNYSPSKHNASRIVDIEGLAPTVMENHGTVTAILEGDTNRTICLNSKSGRNGIDGLQPSRKDRIYSSDGIACTIATNDFYNPNYLVSLILPYKIRKLTPKECWRLMGFNDEDFEKAAKVNSNAQLYKQAGNSIVVNVLMAIFNNLLKGK